MDKVHRSVRSDNIIILAKTSEAAVRSTTRRTSWRTSGVYVCTSVHPRSRSGHPLVVAVPRGKIEEERQRRSRVRRSGLRVTGSRFIRGERSKVIAQARRGEMSPAGSFRAATPSGRPHPRRRLVHVGSTSSRGRTTTTTATTKGDNAARRRSKAYDDDRSADPRELIGKRDSDQPDRPIECGRRACLGRRMLRLRKGTRGSRVATLFQAEAPRERGCHRGCVQVHLGRMRATGGHRLWAFKPCYCGLPRIYCRYVHSLWQYRWYITAFLHLRSFHEFRVDSSSKIVPSWWMINLLSRY